MKLPVGYIKLKDEQKEVLKSFAKGKEVFVSRCGLKLGYSFINIQQNVVW